MKGIALFTKRNLWPQDLGSHYDPLLESALKPKPHIWIRFLYSCFHKHVQCILIHRSYNRHWSRVILIISISPNMRLKLYSVFNGEYPSITGTVVINVNSQSLNNTIHYNFRICLNSSSTRVSSTLICSLTIHPKEDGPHSICALTWWMVYQLPQFHQGKSVWQYSLLKCP